MFACMSEKGNVGVGPLTEGAVRVRDFKVTVDGAEKRILEVKDLEVPNTAENANDPEMSAYLVRVEWIEACPAEEAFWEKGMYANQNSATKLRNKFTLEMHSTNC